MKEITLAIEKMVGEGRGLGYLDGKAVFIRYALPGEVVKALITSSRKDYDTAKLIDVLQPSPRRVPAPCALFTHCGGCQLQHADYPCQLEM